MQQNTQPQANMTGPAPAMGVAGVPQTNPMQAPVQQAQVQAQPTAITGTAVKTTAANQAAAASTPTSLPTSIKIETLLEECIRRGASDLHIQVGLPPILRIDGSLTPIPNTPALTSEMVEKLVFSTLDSMQREVLS